MRAISRRVLRSRALDSSPPVADWKRIRKSSCRLSPSFSSSSSSVIALRSLAFKEISLPLHEPRLHRQLLGGKAKRLARERLGDARELEHHAARLHDGDPSLGRALSRSHAGLGRLLRERLVGEEVDPHLAAAADLPRHRDPGSLDLAVRDPPVLERLDPVVAVLHVELALRVAGAPPAELLAVLRLARHQHQASPPSGVASGVSSVTGGVGSTTGVSGAWSAGGACVSGAAPAPRSRSRGGRP